MFVQLITELLQGGFAVKFRASGRSMQPTICEGETITVEPIAAPEVRPGDIILYRSNGRVIAHRVIQIMKFSEEAVETSKFDTPADYADLAHSQVELNTGRGVCHVQPAEEDMALSAQDSAAYRSLNGQIDSAEKTLFSAQPAAWPRPVASGADEDGTLLESSLWRDPFVDPGDQSAATNDASCIAQHFILRGDAATSCDDPVLPDQVLGKVVWVQRNGGRINLCSRKSRWQATLRCWAAAVKRSVLKTASPGIDH